MREIFSFIINGLTPELAIAGGVPFPPVKRDEKPDLMVAKGGNFFGNIGKWFSGGNHRQSYGNYTPPPAPPVPPPTPPPPPPPTLATPSQTDAGVYEAGYQQQKDNANKFGFRSTMLQGAANTATGSGSLLGN
jgi:hypothetical protein